MTYRHLAASEKYSSVGQLLGHVDSVEGYSFAASGVLIAENWVLTAAHVVLLADAMTGELEFVVDGEEYPVVEWMVYPEFNWDPWEGNDIALVKLSGNVPEIKPAILYRGDEELGRIGTSVGYGTTGTGLTGANLQVPIDQLEKRAGRNVIDGHWPVDRPTLLFSDFDNPGNPGDNVLGSSEPLDLEYLIAAGDSGGGLFIGDYLVGIHSIGIAVDGEINSDYGDVSGQVRVSPYVRWIENAVGLQLPSAATWTTIADSADFENPRFSAGDLEGQDGWLHAGSGRSLAVIQTAVTKTGSQAVRVDRLPNADGRWAVPVVGYPADRYVIIRWDMNVAQTLGAPFGPFFGVETYDDNGGFGLLGSLGVDASTGDILYQYEDSGFLSETGAVVDFNRWNAYAIRLDFQQDEYSVFCNGKWLATTGFVDRGLGLDDFTDADISTLAAAADAASQAATGTAFFDSFSVIQVPSLGFGDLDANGIVDDGDLNLLLSSFGRTGLNQAADLDFDGFVGVGDLELLLSNFNQPPPATLASPTPSPESSAFVFGQSPAALLASVATVPEPSAFVLAALGIGVLFFCPSFPKPS